LKHCIFAQFFTVSHSVFLRADQRQVGSHGVEIFHERYRRTLVRWFKITDTLPDAWDLYDVPKNCWFVQFSLINDDTLTAQPRLVAVSKRTGEIVYDDGEVRHKRIS
jgi:hypothetical protein